MIQNNLSNSCQSGFRQNDSCVDQLISVTLNIYGLFDANSFLEVRGIFLDLSKALDKIWHENRLNKIKNNGTNRKSLQLIESFLHNRRQRVILNGQSSSWLLMRAGGSILGLLFFLI